LHGQSFLGVTDPEEDIPKEEDDEDAVEDDEGVEEESDFLSFFSSLAKYEYSFLDGEGVGVIGAGIGRRDAWGGGSFINDIGGI